MKKKRTNNTIVPILLIMAAGGSFGMIIKEKGVGDMLQQMDLGSLAQGSLVLLVPFLISAALKTEQGSSTTVLVITSTLVDAQYSRVVSKSNIPCQARNQGTESSAGKAMFGMLAIFAEFERDIIQQRTKAGLEAAKKRGRVGGRPAIDEKKKKQVRALFETGESANDIMKEYDIGRATIYKITKIIKGKQVYL